MPMGLNSWIARVVRLAKSLRADHWSDTPWRRRRDLHADDLTVRRLEERRVLSATIQAITLPDAAVEGDTVAVSAEATGFGDLSFDWTITRDSTVIARGFTKDFSFETPDDGTYDVSLRVTDDADQVFDVEKGQFLVANARPAIVELAATPIDENGVTLLSGRIDDPGPSDTFELDINWGDPLSPGNLQTIDLSGALPPGVTFDPESREFTVQHQYLDDNPTVTNGDTYSVQLTARDDAGDFGQALVSVKVNNVRPQLEGLSAVMIHENQSTVLSGTINDPGSLDTFTLVINWGDPGAPGNEQTIDLLVPTPGVTFDPESRAFTVEHQYLDDNPTGTPSDTYQISARVIDDDRLASSPAETAVAVKNVAPALVDVAATNANEAGQTTLTGKIVDPGTLDSFRLTVQWGDGAEETFEYAAGTTEFSETHTYADDNPTGTPSDLVTIKLSLEDDDTGVGQAEAVITVANVAPTLMGLAATSLNENQKTVLTGKIVDPGSHDTHTLSINWGDPLSPGNVQVIDLAAPLPGGITYSEQTGEFSVEHQYLDDSPSGTPADNYSIAVTVTDDDAGVGMAETTAEVANVAPAIIELEAIDVDENGVTTLSGKIVDPGTLDVHTLSINWGDPLSPGNVQVIDLAAPLPEGVTYDPETREFTVEHHYLDDNPTGTPTDNYTIAVTVTDDDAGAGMAQTDVQVANVAPMLTDVTAIDIDENGVTTLSGRIVDPGSLDTFTLTVNWSDGTVQDYTSTPGADGIDLLNPPEGVTYDPLTRAFTIEHQYLDDNPTATASDPYEIRLTLVDDDTDMAVDATTITVSNVAPMVVELSATSILENGTTTLSGAYQDPGKLDTQTVVIEWDDPNNNADSTFSVDALADLILGDTFSSSTDGAVLTITALTADTVSFTVQHKYLDDGPAPGNATASDVSTIRLTVTDDDTGHGSSETTVRVSNAAPVIDALEGVTIEEGDKVAIFDGVVDDFTAAAVVVGTFTDAGTTDLHTATVNWGDGHATELLSVDQLAGAGGLFGSHTYADNGVYTVTVTVADDDGGTDEATFTVTVLNVDPELTGTDGHEVLEGDPVTLAGLGVGLTDPGFDNPLNTLDPANGGETQETFTGVMIDWGDGSPTDLVNIIDRVNGSVGTPTTASFSHDAHHYADDGTYTVSVTLRDDDGPDVTRTFEIAVKNVDPTLVLTDEMFVINEGEVLFLPGLGMFTDPGAENTLNPNGPSDETFHYTVDWGDGETDELQLPVSVIDGGAGVGKSGEIANQHFYADNDPDSVYTITVTLYDDDGGMDQQHFEIVVNNVNPTWQPLTEAELIDDDWMPDLFADAKDIEGDGVTVLVLRFTDPGADTFEVWIDWGDQLDEPAGDDRFVLETPDGMSYSDKGVTLYFTHAYTGPPNPADPAADIEVTALVVDDDYSAATAGQLVIPPESTFLVEPGRSEPVSALATNPGLDAGGVAIDTTADVALLEFPTLDEFVEPPEQQITGDAGVQTQDAPAGGGDQAAVSERAWELRAVTPDGKVSQPFLLKPDAMEDLPGLFVRLPDGRYLIFLVRTENNTRRLALDIYLRNGKPIDIGDDSDGARDKPPTTEDGDLDPGIEQIEIELDALDPLKQETQFAPRAPLFEPAIPRDGSRRGAGLLVTAGVAAAIARPKPPREYREQVEEALEQNDPHAWRLLGALRRRPR